MAKVAFLFPGQGAQFVGMGAALADSKPEAAALFRQAGDILGEDLLELCRNGPAERLNATDMSQPAIFVSSLAALESLRQSEPMVFDECVATAGLSLGEYTALVFAGAMSFEDGLKVVRERGRAMQAAAEATPSGMISALLLDLPVVEEVVREASVAGRIRIANYLCPGNTVLSGDMAAINAAERIIEEKSGKPIRLTVAGAFHTDLMKPADERLAAVLAGATISPPKIPVWSNVDARPHSDPVKIRDLLVRQVLSPVRWEETIRALLAEGVERFYEIGPGKVLAGLLKRINRKIECRNCAA
ncbi:ACP S-malonyltransferase [Zavarzinella formosa]|uniref:ACP S-malonyltransferase n=1 Tax=Zavarzinella formosa TaxID=360055 RepID=UPI0002DB36E3|nr:ACP S-malonyltransferase [Zavarzinella formosa]